MSKQEEAPKAKGMRRHNASNGRGTLMQGVAVSQPKWVETAIPGVLTLTGAARRGGNSNILIARDKSNRWASVSKAALKSMLPLPVEP